MRAGFGGCRGRAPRQVERAGGRRQLRRAHVVRDARAEHEAFQQRIAREPVAAVQAGRGHFAAGPEPGHGRRAVRVGRDPAHVEVRGGRDRQGLTRGIEAGRAGDGRGSRKAGLDPGHRSRIEQRTLSVQSTQGDGACDDVPGSELGIRDGSPA